MSSEKVSQQKPPQPLYAQALNMNPPTPSSLKAKKMPLPSVSEKTPTKRFSLLEIFCFALIGLLLFTSGLMLGLWLGNRNAQSHATASKEHPSSLPKKGRQEKPKKTQVKNKGKTTKNMPPSSEKKYIVQFGSFSSRNNAEDLRERLMEKNVTTTITEATTTGQKKIFTLMSETAHSYEEAFAISRTLNQETGLASTVLIQANKGTFRP